MNRNISSSFYVIPVVVVAAMVSNPIQAQTASPRPDTPTITAPLPTDNGSASTSSVTVSSSPDATLSAPQTEALPKADIVSLSSVDTDRAARKAHPASHATALATTTATKPVAALKAIVQNQSAQVPMKEPALATPPLVASPKAALETGGAVWTANTKNDELLAGLVAALGFAGAALIYIGRKRKLNQPIMAADAPPLHKDLPRTKVAVPVTPIASPTVMAILSKPAPSLSVTAPVLIDSDALPTGPERLALVHRMAASAPDAKNPFLSPKARRRRARALLQAYDKQPQLPASKDISERFDNWSYQPWRVRVSAKFKFVSA